MRYEKVYHSIVLNFRTRRDRREALVHWIGFKKSWREWIPENKWADHFFRLIGTYKQGKKKIVFEADSCSFPHNFDQFA